MYKHCIISELSLLLPNTDTCGFVRPAFKILNKNVHLEKVMVIMPFLDGQHRSQHFTEAEGKLK